MVMGQTQSQLGCMKLQVFNDDEDNIIIIDASDIRFYD